MRFLSGEWFSAVEQALQCVSVNHDACARLVFNASGTQWHLTVTGGRVTSWGRGAIGDPDCELRWDTGDAARIWARCLRGGDALLATTVVTRDVDGPYVGTPAPLDLARRRELAGMPRVPGATLSVQYRYANGPFGDVGHVLRFEDGLVVDEQLGTLDAPDVTVDVTYRTMALVRAGEMTILEALEDGHVEGPIGALAALAGISESPEFEAAQIATGRHAIALATLGDLDATPDFAAAMQDVASFTPQP